MGAPLSPRVQPNPPDSSLGEDAFITDIAGHGIFDGDERDAVDRGWQVCLNLDNGESVPDVQRDVLKSGAPTASSRRLMRANLFSTQYRTSAHSCITPPSRTHRRAVRFF